MITTDNSWVFFFLLFEQNKNISEMKAQMITILLEMKNELSIYHSLRMTISRHKCLFTNFFFINSVCLFASCSMSSYFVIYSLINETFLIFFLFFSFELFCILIEIVFLSWFCTLVLSLFPFSKQFHEYFIYLIISFIHWPLKVRKRKQWRHFAETIFLSFSKKKKKKIFYRQLKM